MMRAEVKTKEQLISEVDELRRRVAELESMIAPIRTDGEVYGLVGANADFAERKRAEKALRESESRYRALAESTRDIIYILDRQGTLLYANQAASQCIGIPVNDILGKRQVDLFPPQMARAHLEKVGRVFATGEVMEEDEYFHFGPEEVWLRINLLPLRDEAGQITSVMGVCHNITHRKRAEKALQEAHDDLERRVEERTAELAKVNENLDIFRKFAEASGEGFGMSDFDGGIAYVNPTLCRFFGEEKPEDVIGKNITRYYPEEYAQQRKQDMIPALLREGYWHAEQTLLPRHGKPIQVLQSTFLIRDESGSPFRIAVVITDITQSKQAEAALRKEYRTLKHLLHSSDHERQLIAYEIHDGLAQQLAGALMQFQAFHHLKDKNPQDAEKAYDAGLTMLQQGHFEARRLIAGVRPPILDESGVVEAVAHLVHEEGRDQGSKIDFHSRVDFDRLAPTLENAVYRIVQEALANACQHSKSERVRVGLAQRGSRVRIQVRDWGVGFDPQTVRGDRFGLEGIRQRVRLLGGKCSFQSSPGKGTRITVELPVVERETD